jgi:hypothetical protein
MENFELIKSEIYAKSSMMNITQKKLTITMRGSRRYLGGSSPNGETNLTPCRVARSKTTTTKMMAPLSPYMISTRNPIVMPTFRTQ